MSNRIFISHSLGADRQWVRELAESLKAHGTEVWVDQLDFKPGDSLTQAIEKGLRESDTVIFIVTPESVRSKWFLFELGAAIGMGKRAIPIMAHDVPDADVPFPLRARVALPKEAPDETARKLLAAMHLETSTS